MVSPGGSKGGNGGGALHTCPLSDGAFIRNSSGNSLFFGRSHPLMDPFRNDPCAVQLSCKKAPNMRGSSTWPVGRVCKYTSYITAHPWSSKGCLWGVGCFFHFFHFEHKEDQLFETPGTKDIPAVSEDIPVSFIVTRTKNTLTVLALGDVHVLGWKRIFRG